MPEMRPMAAYRRLVLALLLAPALLWLFALIVLPHVDLAVLSLRERVAPRQYVPSLAQYRTFFGEPLYWHVFADSAGRLSDRLDHREACARPHERAAVRSVPDSFLGE